MKVAFTTLLAASLVGVAIFGVFGMHTNMQDHDGGCALAQSQGANCPKQVSPIDYIIFHLGAFRSVSTATFSDGLFSSLILLALLIVGIGLGMLSGNASLLQLSSSYYRYEPELFISSQKRGLLEWTSLHENSPTIS